VQTQAKEGISRRGAHQLRVLAWIDDVDGELACGDQEMGDVVG
jgi:hypothetical protein